MMTSYFDDGGQFFSTPSLSKQLKLAHHLIGYSDNFLVVTGVEGSGKTRFLHESAELAGDRRICQLQGRELVDTAALMQKLSLHFAVAAVESDSDGVQAIRELLRKASRPAGAVVLMVDDAQLLASATLELLIDLACSEEKEVLRLVLAVPPTAMTVIGQLAQRRGAGQRVHCIDMPSLSEEETADFLHLLLSQAEWSGDSPFDDTAVHTIYQRSNGLPGRIQQVAAEMLQPPQEVSSFWTGTTGRLAVWGIIAAVLLLASWSLFRGDAEAPKKQLSHPALPPQAVTQPEPLIPITPEVPAVATVDHGPSPEVEASAEPVVQPLPMETAVDRDEIPPPEVVTSVPAVVPPAPQEPTATEPAIELKTVVKTTVNEAPGTVQVEQRVALDSSLQTKPALPEALAALHDLFWLAKQKPEHHTIQIFATYHLQSLDKFVVSRAIDKDFAWFETVHRGKPWYVLVHGIYQERNDARAAIAALPSALRQAKPWIRTIASITATATSSGQ